MQPPVPLADGATAPNRTIPRATRHSVYCRETLPVPIANQTESAQSAIGEVPIAGLFFATRVPTAGLAWCFAAISAGTGFQLPVDAIFAAPAASLAWPVARLAAGCSPGYAADFTIALHCPAQLAGQLTAVDKATLPAYPVMSTVLIHVAIAVTAVIPH